MLAGKPTIFLQSIGGSSWYIQKARGGPTTYAVRPDSIAACHGTHTDGGLVSVIKHKSCRRKRSATPQRCSFYGCSPFKLQDQILVLQFMTSLKLATFLRSTIKPTYVHCEERRTIRKQTNHNFHSSAPEPGCHVMDGPPPLSKSVPPDHPSSSRCHGKMGSPLNRGPPASFYR